MKRYPLLQSLELYSKRVFLRLDLNVPLKKNENGELKVSDNSRIMAALQTIQHVKNAGGKCIVASHLGRPEGKADSKYSLAPVGEALSEILNQDVILTDDCIGDGAQSLSHQVRPGEVLLLENLRFHEGEEKNSADFANKLLELCDVYVTDAFGTLHRAHASTHMLPKICAHRGIGFLIQEELKHLEPLRENPKRPFALVMGGSKISDKMGVLEHFLSKVDKIFVGGAMAYAFLKVKQFEIGKSLCDLKQVQLAERILKSAEARNIEVLLPEDHVVTLGFEEVGSEIITKDSNIPKDMMGMDVGPKTLASFQKGLEGIETIFWNGPMGVFEKPNFAKGTFELAKIIAQSPAQKFAGGGDSTAAIKESGCNTDFTFISTGGGATLEFLEGKELPGLKVLEIPTPRS